MKKHNTPASSKCNQSHGTLQSSGYLISVPWITSRQPLWVFVNPLSGLHAAQTAEDGVFELAVFTCEAVAREEATHEPILQRLVAHEASWEEVRAMADEQCEGRWRLHWMSQTGKEFKGKRAR